jgi:glucose-1-phosphate cytidylyltransferase
MVEIGGKPILWHIMKIYSHYGFNDFVICLGYKGHYVKEFFANYFVHNSDIEISLSNNSLKVLNSNIEPWNITLVDTGLDTMTGGRIKRVQKYLNNEPFFLTYGDGLSDVNIADLLEYHKKQGKYCTVTAVQPAGKFGALDINNLGIVGAFEEKPRGDKTWINGGFFVCEPQIFDYLKDDSTILERQPMEKLAKDNQLAAFKHESFWRPMDTLRDKTELEEEWQGTARWKVW